MKVAIVSPDDISVVLFCKGLVEALQKDNKICIISDIYGENTDGYYTKILASWNVKHIPVKFYRFIDPVKDLKYLFSLYKIFRTEKIDMVINICTKQNIYGTIAAKLANVKTIVCSVWGMGTVFSESNSMKIKLLRLIVLSLYRLAFKLSSKVWFTNQTDANYFISQGVVTLQKLILTKNYVNTEEYSPSSVNQERILSLRKELGLNEQHKVVIMVARMSWSKGVREFVDAAAIFKDKFPTVKFILVGPKDEGSPDRVPESYLIEHQQNYSNFMWTGFRRDVKEFYAIADLAVYPSYYREGGFPRGLTEPMAMGKPIITTNSEHCRGTVEEGKNGYLIPIKDAHALANAIEKLINDDHKRKEFGKYSQLKAQREFSEKIIISQVVKEIFSSTISQ